MISRLHWFLFASLLLAMAACDSSKKAKKVLPSSYRVAFYNIENLFDTLDHPVKFDEAFTPSGKQEWRTDRLQKKLDDLCKVVAGMEFPSVLGICEVENAAVIEDFINKTDLSKHNYKYVHYESPDMRGIDNALLYRADHFKVLESNAIRVPFPDSIAADYTSRDIIYIKGLLGKNKTAVHLFVNHWPSRRGGLAKSEPKRVHVANYVKEAVDKIMKKDANAHILIMGDFNDEPDNNSIANTLGAKLSSDNIAKESLYNCMAKLDAQNKGSYNYRGNWNMLDQIIVSGALAHPDPPFQVGPPTVFQREWMMYQDKKYGAKPSRTYGGPNYYGGFSDHLPVFVDLMVKK